MEKSKTRKRRFRIGEDEKEIIKIVGLGLLAVTSIVFPGLPMALQPIFKRRHKKGFQKILKHLETDGFVPYVKIVKMVGSVETFLKQDVQNLKHYK